MQLHGKATLCESENGKVSVVNSGVAYKLNFKQITLYCTAQQLQALKHYIEHLDANVWFKTAEAEFALIHFAPLCANYYLTRKDLQEISQLLLEATAMIKVHRHLFFKKDKTRIN